MSVRTIVVNLTMREAHAAAVRVAAVVAEVTGLPVRTGPGHPDWPHRDGRIPLDGWNLAERAARDVYKQVAFQTGEDV